MRYYVREWWCSNCGVFVECIDELKQCPNCFAQGSLKLNDPQEKEIDIE